MKVARNDLCKCGSGKKFKKCCLNIHNNKGDSLPDSIDYNKPIPRTLELHLKLFAPYLRIEVNELELPQTTHDLRKGFRQFVLGRLEQLLIELRSNQIDDNRIKYISGNLFLLFQNSLNHYLFTLMNIYDDIDIDSVLREEDLTKTEWLLLSRTVVGNLSEYAGLSFGQKPDYEATRVLNEFCYISLLNRLQDQDNYRSATIYVDTGDILSRWVYHSSESDLNQFSIIWHTLAPTENQFKALTYSLQGLETESIKSLNTTLIQEKSIPNNSKEFVSYSGLAMGYFGVIEFELRALIGLREKTRMRYMWREICSYFKENQLHELINQDLILQVLIDFNGIRNKAAHGEFISYEEFINIKNLTMNYKILEDIASAKLMLM